MKVLLGAVIIGCVAGLLSCGGSTGDESATPADSQMVAEHVDPSTKFPQQLVEADTLQTDVQFVDNAIQSVQETIALAELALQKATQPNVKEIAQNITRDQRQLYSDLQRLQKPRSPADSTKRFTDGSRQELEKLAGVAFDKQWVEKMVTRNAAMISRYEAESGAAKDKGVKRLVNDALPKLKAHQQQLETCRAKLQ